MAARKPVMSPRTPPPKARRSESRSAPAVASCWARDSTLPMRLCDSPLGRKRTVGGSLKDQRALTTQLALKDGSSRVSGDWGGDCRAEGGDSVGRCRHGAGGDQGGTGGVEYGLCARRDCGGDGGRGGRCAAS